MTISYVSEMTGKKTKTILVVDDEPENLRSYQEILCDMGYQVLLQPDGASALELLGEDAAVDLIITDFRMPGLNGLEFITELRYSRPFVPVVMITAYGNIETYLHSVSLGVFEYVHKPVNKEEFERIVKHALHDAGPGNAAGDEALL
jgi:DNA-binding NtrC family response regulator